MVSDIGKIFLLWDSGQLIFILSRTRIIKDTLFVGPRNKNNCGLKLMLAQITQWCNYIEEIMKITNVKPNINYKSLAYLNQYIFTFQICDIYLPQYQNGSVYSLMSQKNTSYIHIGLTLCLRTTARKYNAVGYASGTDISMHLRPFMLIYYICGFI